jgi:hypothetical protein
MTQRSSKSVKALSKPLFGPTSLGFQLTVSRKTFLLSTAYLRGNTKKYLTASKDQTPISSICSTMAKLNFTIPDLELPDGRKVPMVCSQKLTRKVFDMCHTNVLSDRIWHWHGLVQARGRG